jgi:hypothetical protein
MVTTSAFLSTWSGSVFPDLIGSLIAVTGLIAGVHLLVSYVRKAVDAS